MANPSPLCPSCGVPVGTDKVCLACLFDDALHAENSDVEEISFGDFAPLTAGTFGKYILRQKLGEGGMGVIWEAEDTTLQRVVALKMIRGFAFSADSEKQRFQAEASAIAQLDHPHIVPVYEVGEIDEQPYFSMKLLKGGSLSQRVKKGAMDDQEAAAIMEKLSRAIHHAHGRGVLHRDLKPSNVLLDESGEPHLTDFGLAKLQDSSMGLTVTHAQIGTPQYMSPEQARGRARDITPASDVWGAGALFYRLLCGRLPFPGSGAGEILDRIANEDPEPMQSSPEEQIDKQLETLCMRCLQKDPAQRLPSAEFLADELSRWLSGEPIESAPLHRRPAKRKRGLLAAVVTVMACLLVPVAIHLSPSRDDTPPQGSLPQNLLPEDGEHPGSPPASGGIDLSQTIEAQHVFLDATEGTSEAGVWIQPGDQIKFAKVLGGYTYGQDSTIWSAAGDEESNSIAGKGFTFPEIRPWALVGLVRSNTGKTLHFPIAEDVDYPGDLAGELCFALNTPAGEAGRAGGFTLHLKVSRKSRIVASGTNEEQAWGAPILKLGKSDIGFAMYISGQVQYSEDSAFVPAGRISSHGGKDLLAPHLGQQALIAKIGQGKAFALQPAFQQLRSDYMGWLHFSVNDEIARPGAYADNRGSITMSASINRPHQKLVQRISEKRVTMRTIAHGNKRPSFYVRAQDFEAEARSPRIPQVFLQTEPSPGMTKISVKAVKFGWDTYAFVAENFPAAPSVDTANHSPFFVVEDQQTVHIRWSRDLYGRALFRLREPLVTEPGAESALSFETSMPKPNLFLLVTRDGRLHAHASNGTEGFDKVATWRLEHEE